MASLDRLMVAPERGRLGGGVGVARAGGRQLVHKEVEIVERRKSGVRADST